MKKFAIQVSSNDPGKPQVVLGHFAFDAQSGGYPYMTQFQLLQESEARNEMERIFASRDEMLSDNGEGGLYWNSNIGFMASEYRSKYHGSAANTEVDVYVRIDLLQLDFTNMLNVKTEVIRTICFEAREAKNAKTREKAHSTMREL